MKIKAKCKCMNEIAPQQNIGNKIPKDLNINYEGFNVLLKESFSKPSSNSTQVCKIILVSLILTFPYHIRSIEYWLSSHLKYSFYNSASSTSFAIYIQLSFKEGISRVTKKGYKFFKEYGNGNRDS